MPRKWKNEGKHVMLLHARIGLTQISGLIMRASCPSFCVLTLITSNFLGLILNFFFLSFYFVWTMKNKKILSELSLGYNY